MNDAMDRLYSLLPVFIRNRDYHQGQPLRALMEVLGDEYAALTGNLEDLYHDWFIETCDPWVVPYIGDLIGIGEAEWGRDRFRDFRSLVANSIHYRRRKGVPATLAQVAQDATGWYTTVVQCSRLLVRAQALARLHPGAGGSAAVRDATALATLGGPFDVVARSADLRRGNRRRRQIAIAEGPPEGFNLPTLALFVWRLQTFPLERVPAWRRDPGSYRFHPLGVDTPLFNRPRAPAEPTAPRGERNLPVALTPSMLRSEIEALRRDRRPPYDLLGIRPSFEIRVGGEPIPAAAIEIADLSSWRRPSSGASYSQIVPGGREERPIAVVVDPHRGRLAFPEGRSPAGPVEVSFRYALAADVGGGPCERAAPAPASGRSHWRAWVGTGPTPAGFEHAFSSLETALEAWRDADVQQGYLRLAGGADYRLATGSIAIDMRGGRHLVLGVGERETAILRGRLEVRGDRRPGAGLRVENLWIDGGLELHGGTGLEIVDCTVRTPGAGGSRAGLVVRGRDGDPNARVVVTRSIVGPIHHHSGALDLVVRDSIVDGRAAAGDEPIAFILGEGSHDARLAAVLERCTIFGRVELLALERASDVIFTAPVEVRYPARGEVGYSYVPPGSRTPRRIHCQPDLALGQVDGERGARIEPRLRPVFVSRHYGQPGYAQLGETCPREIRIGSRSGSQMGVFERLDEPRREAALELAAEEYVPYGMEARVIYVT